MNSQKMPAPSKIAAAEQQRAIDREAFRLMATEGLGVEAAWKKANELLNCRQNETATATHPVQGSLLADTEA